MTVVGLQEVQAQFEQLLQRVTSGEEFEIHVAGEPVARLVPVRPSRKRTFGYDRGRFEVPEDFNAPLPAELLAEFNPTFEIGPADHLSHACSGISSVGPAGVGNDPAQPAGQPGPGQ